MTSYYSVTVLVREGASSQIVRGQIGNENLHGKSIIHWQGSTIFISSFQQLPCLRLILLKGILRGHGITAPFKGLRLASCAASRTTEIQGHLQVCRARRAHLSSDVLFQKKNSTINQDIHQKLEPPELRLVKTRKKSHCRIRRYRCLDFTTVFTK